MSSPYTETSKNSQKPSVLRTRPPASGPSWRPTEYSSLQRGRTVSPQSGAWPGRPYTGWGRLLAGKRRVSTDCPYYLRNTPIAAVAYPIP